MKCGDEEEVIVLIHLVGAGGRRGSVRVHEAVDSGADCDTETKKQRVLRTLTEFKS